jgi:hypothetical protein
VRMEIERAFSKGCSFYFLSISLIIHWRTFTQISISINKCEEEKKMNKKNSFFSLITPSFLMIELA